MTPNTRACVFWLALAAIAALGLGLRADVFRFEFTADDYAQVGMMTGAYPVARAPLSLFTFSDGSRGEVRVLTQAGFYPWFTHPELRLSMLRPLSSALMWLDLLLFGRAGFGYHVHSALWWVALLVALALLLRRMFDARLALFALLLFALDEAQGVLLGWIANRNAMVSVVFSLIALGAYLRFREQAWRPGRVVACVCFVLALAGGEYALSMLCYFVAYELWGAEGTFAVRARALLLVLVPALIYLGVRHLGGFGAIGSDMYIDPLRAPLALVRQGLPRLPVLAADLMLGVHADFWFFGCPWLVYPLRWGWLPPSFFLSPEPWRAVHAALGCVALALAWVIGAFVIRAACESVPRAGVASVGRRVRFLGLGALLSLVPLMTTFPSSRSLAAPLIGWSVVTAALVEPALRRLRTSGRLRSRVAASLALAFVVFHLCVGPYQTRLDTRAIAISANLTRDLALNAQLDERSLPGQRVILMHAAEQGTPVYFSLIRSLYGRAVPRSFWTLSPAYFAYFLSRPSSSRLELELVGGTLLSGEVEHIFRAREARVVVGQRFELDGMTATLLAMQGEGATRLRFDFDRPLEDPSLVFLISTVRGLERFALPAIGERIAVPPPALP